MSSSIPDFRAKCKYCGEFIEKTGEGPWQSTAMGSQCDGRPLNEDDCLQPHEPVKAIPRPVVDHTPPVYAEKPAPIVPFIPSSPPRETK